MSRYKKLPEVMPEYIVVPTKAKDAYGRPKQGRWLYYIYNNHVTKAGAKYAAEHDIDCSVCLQPFTEQQHVNVPTIRVEGVRTAVPFHGECWARERERLVTIALRDAACSPLEVAVVAQVVYGQLSMLHNRWLGYGVAQVLHTISDQDMPAAQAESAVAEMIFRAAYEHFAYTLPSMTEKQRDNITRWLDLQVPEVTDTTRVLVSYEDAMAMAQEDNRACVLTGAIGENTNDCTTHAHDAGDAIAGL